jgi:Uri superfamily endonuclease
MVRCARAWGSPSQAVELVRCRTLLGHFTAVTKFGCSDSLCRPQEKRMDDCSPSPTKLLLRVKTQLTMLRFNGLVNRIGGPTDAGELILV